MEAKTRKNIISAIITLAILGLAFMISGKLAGMKKSTVGGKPKVKERRIVSVQQYSPTEASNTISLDGRLLAHDRVSITSKVQGVMQPTGTRLREGMYVKQGALLFDLDNTEAQYQQKAQMSALMTSITQMMPDLKFDYPASFEQWQAYLAAFDIDGSLAPLPDAVTEQERYFVASRNIYNQYYNIKSTATRLADYKIYAPFSGVVTGVNVTPGALVSPGQALASMINTATYEMKAPVPLSTLQYVKVGDKVTVKSDDLDRQWQGRVVRVGTLIDEATQNVPLYISVSGRGLKDGMYLRGELAGSTLADVYVLPRSVLTSPTSVFVVEDSTIVSKVVEPVKRSDEGVLLRGLSPDDLVVSGSKAGLIEGQKVSYE